MEDGAVDGASEVEDNVSSSSECRRAAKRLERHSQVMYVLDAGILRSEYKSAVSPVQRRCSIYLDVVHC